MILNKIDKIIEIVKPVLQKKGVIKAGIFGSYSREQYNENSDIDFVIQFGSEKGLFDLSGLQLELERVLGIKVDIVTYDSLNYLIRNGILEDEVPII